MSVMVKNPTAKIANSKNNILKLYGNKVYMEDGEQFKLELYNPKTTPVLAKIYLNDTLISNSGIVLRPGERVWLDRYIDVAKKFKFETYEVGTTLNDFNAIQNNGKVKVEFYDEQINITWWNDNSRTFTNPGWGQYNTAIGTGKLTYSTTTADTLCINSSDITLTNNSNFNSKQETGRIAQGGKSKQKLESAYGNFCSCYSYSIEYQILPKSKKQEVYATELRTYCTECGARKKKTQWKHCPECGTKY